MIWIALLLVFWLAFGMYASKREVKEWNNGYCTCGGRWQTFDMDSSGAIGHKCDLCNTTIWTSWHYYQQRLKVS